MNKVENKRFNIMKNNDYKFSTMIFLRKYNTTKKSIDFSNR